MLALGAKCSPDGRQPLRSALARPVREWTSARLETRVLPPRIALPSAQSARSSARPSAVGVSPAPARQRSGGHGRLVAEPHRNGLALHSASPARSAHRDAPSRAQSPIARTGRCNRRRASARAPSSPPAAIRRPWPRTSPARSATARPSRKVCAALTTRPSSWSTHPAGIRLCSARRHHRFGGRTPWNPPPRGKWLSAVRIDYQLNPRSFESREPFVGRVAAGPGMGDQLVEDLLTLTGGDPGRGRSWPVAGSPTPAGDARREATPAPSTAGSRLRCCRRGQERLAALLSRSPALVFSWAGWRRWRRSRGGAQRPAPGGSRRSRRALQCGWNRLQPPCVALVQARAILPSHALVGGSWISTCRKLSVVRPVRSMSCLPTSESRCGQTDVPRRGARLVGRSRRIRYR